MKTNDFDFIADYYQLLSSFVFGESIAKSQLYFLDKIPSQSTILLVGEGTGIFLEELISKNLCRKIVVVEPSAKMIKISQNRISKLKYSTEIVYMNEELESIHFNEKFDCLVTNFFLDLFCKPEVKELMQVLKNLINHDGLWLFTDFKISKNSFHSFWQIGLMKIMYTFFAIVSNVKAREFEDFSASFENLQMLKMYQKTFFCGMIDSAVYKK